VFKIMWVARRPSCDERKLGARGHAQHDCARAAKRRDAMIFFCGEDGRRQRGSGCRCAPVNVKDVLDADWNTKERWTICGVWVTGELVIERRADAVEAALFERKRMQHRLHGSESIFNCVEHSPKRRLVGFWRRNGTMSEKNGDFRS
jgi:hypothetical protein